MLVQSCLRSIAGLSIAIGGIGQLQAADWLQTGYDSAHSGFNPLETQLSPVNVASLGKIAAWTVPDFIYGSGVLLENVATAQGYRNVLYAASQSGMVFAMDASSGAMLWSKTTGTAGWSIHPTPVIDPNRQFVYSYGADGKVHKFSAGSGDETIDSAWPELVTTKPDVEHGASGLTIGVTGAGTRYLYAVTTGYFGDGGDYQGHLTTINLDTGNQTVFNALCSDVAVHFIEGGGDGINDCAGRRAGIWGRPGATFDVATGHVYVVTGNGHYDAVLGGFDWGDSVLAVAPDGVALLGDPLDSYTPENYQFLDDDDRDLGSGSLAIVGEVAGYSNGRLGVIVGKDTEVRLLALDDLSGAGGPRHVGGELDMDGDGLVCKCSMPQPAVWTAADGSKWVYVVTEGLRAYEITVADGQPHLTLRWAYADFFSVSTAISSPIVANGVLYVVASKLLAIDAVSGKTLWTSNEWQEGVVRSTPVVSNGRVYVFAAPQGAAEVDVYATDEIFGGNFDPVGRTDGPESSHSFRSKR